MINNSDDEIMDDSPFTSSTPDHQTNSNDSIDGSALNMIENQNISSENNIMFVEARGNKHNELDLTARANFHYENKVEGMFGCNLTVTKPLSKKKGTKHVVKRRINTNNFQASNISYDEEFLKRLHVKYPDLKPECLDVETWREFHQSIFVGNSDDKTCIEILEDLSDVINDILILMKETEEGQKVKDMPLFDCNSPIM